MKLDKEQQAAVESTAEQIVVVAGAGSGKTRVLTERVKHLLDKGVEPHNIVAITFTNMAADEIKARLRNVTMIGDAFIGTIHAFANRIYKASGIRFELLTGEKEILIYEELLNMPKYQGMFEKKRFLQYLDLKKLVDMGKRDEEELSNWLMPSEAHFLVTCQKDVDAIKQRDGIISFDELLNLATQYFESLDARVEHLLVDELQDVDTLQYKFLRALNAENYFFVGDDWQAIYGWKGGNVDIFRDLVKDKRSTVYYLTNNYRNKKEIVTLGERIISQVDKKIPKACHVVSSGRATIGFYGKADTDMIIQLLTRDKENLRDWFILTRTNKEAYTLSDLLDDNDINYCFIRKSELTLEELQDAMKSNLVKIMTAHASKGLESKKVILFGQFPVQVPSYRKNEEERRLMYVGVTRAEEELYIFN